MAIPNYLWPAEQSEGPQMSDPDPSLNASEIATTTDLFETLSNQLRLEILAALYERSESISYTALRDETSIDDKGQFNYHLRQLDSLVRRQNGNYTLTKDGEELLETVVAERT